MIHFHPLGFPVDEFIVLAINSSYVPLSFHVEWARSVLKDVSEWPGLLIGSAKASIQRAAGEAGR